MIALSQSSKYDINYGENEKGNLLVSSFINKGKEYKLPFLSMPKLNLVKIGNGNHANFDEFIIESLNDYYSKLSGPGDLGTKEKMLEDYKKLYSLWLQICECKEKNDVLRINKLYNMISYGLFLIGYEDHLL